MRLPIAPIIFFIAGCGDTKMSTPSTPNHEQKDETPVLAGTKRFLALGDSYTIGEAVPETERWPVQLVAMLRKEGIKIVDPKIIARTGWTTDELSTAIDAASPKGRYDLVSLLIGVNNQYRGRSIEEFRTQFRALFARAVAFAGRCGYRSRAA